MKYAGLIGFLTGQSETSLGVWTDDIVERPYTGEVLRNTRKFQQRKEALTDDLVVSNRISILSDLYMQNNWPSVRYVVWNGVKWKVTSVEVNYPRITLDIGEVYNDATESNTT